MGAGEPDSGQRLDKWLWHARLVKTRTLASRLVMDGKLRVNREKIVKPSTLVSAGDVITAALGGRVRVVRILALSERRLRSAEARGIYDDLIAPGKGQPVAARPKPPPGAGGGL